MRSRLASGLAVFLALGGTAWALQANSVRSRHIVDGTIRSSDVGANSLTGADIDERSLGLGAAYSERTSPLRLTSSSQTVIARTVTVSAPTQLSAVASIQMAPDADLDGRYNAVCQIEVDGLYRSGEYFHDADELGFSVFSVTFGRTVFAGAHTVALRCRKSLDPNTFVSGGMTILAVPLA
jgi:hypothetical protein